MPRKPNIDQPTRLELKLRASTRARLDLHLFSELEGRVPQGKYAEFFEERLAAYFGGRQLDLAPFGFPIGTYVEGSKEAIALLVERLGK